MGFFKIDRQLLSHDLWLSEPFTRGQAWIDMIGLANFKKSFFIVRGIRVEVPRGSFAHSKESLGRRWRWSRGKVLRFVSELEKMEMIIQQKSRVITTIAICNYELYQGNATVHASLAKQQTVQQAEQQTVHIKEDKEIKKINICPFPEIVDLYHQILPELPRVAKLTETRKNKLKARWFGSRNSQSLDWWEQYFRLAESQPFLMGNNSRGWKADFDFLITESKFIKVIEEGYRQGGEQ